jgi:hypothetical protein
MQITANAWNEYITRLSRLNQKAGQLMREYIGSHGTESTDDLIAYAYGLVTKYGEGSAELACQMYDALAEAANAGVPAAEPAEPADYGEVARMVNATKSQNPANLPNGVSRLVKRAGADTTLKNAVRDGAEWAWVPHGDTCPFCITLASNGWQKASSKVLKGGHAQHIHANCDCEFAIRFDHNTTVAGYDPDKYLKQYRDAGGDINKMRRVNYAANKERINAQKRAAYAVKNALPKISNFNPLPENQVVDVLRKEAQPWIDKLSAVEQDAIQKYTYNPGDQRPNRFFERINRMLRGDSEEDAHLRMYAERISDALKRSPLEHDVLCYRAMEFNPFDGMHVGDIVCPGQFYSTSVVKSGSLKKDFRITICARSGSLAGYVEPLSKFKEQRELLFDKDTLYRVLLLKEKEVVLEVTLP